MNEAGRRQADAGALQLQRRSRSLMSQKDFRRSVVINAVAPAGGAVMSACPKRMDAQFEKGTATGTAAHAAAVREWIKANLSDAGCELCTIDQRDWNVMLFNDWLGQNGYEQFADWVKGADGWSAVCRMDDELQPKVPTAESLIECAFQMANGDKASCPKGGRAQYRNGEWYKRMSGRRQGDLMTEANAGEFGHGAHSDTPCVASTRRRIKREGRKTLSHRLGAFTNFSPKRFYHAFTGVWQTDTCRLFKLPRWRRGAGKHDDAACAVLWWGLELRVDAADFDSPLGMRDAGEKTG